MIIGSFQKHVMRVHEPMQLDAPFFREPKALEIITSWPVVIFGEFIFVIITCYIFDKVRQHNETLTISNEEKTDDLN